MKTWFNLTAAIALTSVALAAGAQQMPSEVSIYDEIGAYGVNAKDYMDAFNALPAGDVVVNINSPGGSVYDALAIMNGMRASGRNVTTRVMGMAASAASLVAMAGTKIVMPENTFMMVHNPMTAAYGNADEIRETATMLDQVGNSLTNTYAKRSGQTPAAIAALLAKDTYLTAQECKDLGLCDEVIPAVNVSAVWDIDRKGVPANVRAALGGKPGAPAPIVDPAAALAPFGDRVVAACHAAGLDAFAGAFALDAKITTPESLATAIAEAKEIESLCKVIGKPEAAAPAIQTRTPLAALRETLIAAKVEADKSVRIVSQEPTTRQPQNQQAPAVGVESIWANIRKVNAPAAHA